MSKTKTRWVNDEEESNKAIEEMESQGYEYFKMKYGITNNGPDCYEGAVIIFKKV